MSLKVLCAGCSKDEREYADTAVRQALGERTQGGAWMVSLVKATGQWSVTLDGPPYGGRPQTLVAPLRGLREAITEALAGGEAPPAPVRSAESRSPCQCEKCGKSFVVIYEAVPGESEESVAVACPHCWQVNRVLVAESAAEATDYHAEKA